MRMNILCCLAVDNTTCQKEMFNFWFADYGYKSNIFLILLYFHLKRLNNCTLFSLICLIKESFLQRPIWPLPPSFGPLTNFEVPTLKSHLPAVGLTACQPIIIIYKFVGACILIFHWLAVAVSQGRHDPHPTNGWVDFAEDEQQAVSLLSVAQRPGWNLFFFA